MGYSHVSQSRLKYEDRKKETRRRGMKGRKRKIGRPLKCVTVRRSMLLARRSTTAFYILPSFCSSPFPTLDTSRWFMLALVGVHISYTFLKVYIPPSQVSCIFFSRLLDVPRGCMYSPIHKSQDTKIHSVYYIWPSRFYIRTR